MEGNGSKPMSILQEIQNRLAAITPDQYIAPSNKRDEKATFVAFASDDAKALSTMSEILSNEIRAQASGGIQTVMGAFEDAFARGLNAAETGKSLALKEQEMRALSCELHRKGNLLEIITTILCEQMIRENPALSETSFELCDDWAIVICPEEPVVVLEGASLLPGELVPSRLFAD